MLHKCANPSCPTPFRNIHRGKLFHISVETLPGKALGDATPAQRRVEHYWLCDACTGILTLVVDQEKGLLVVPLATFLQQSPFTIMRQGRPVNDGPDNLGENWEFRRNGTKL